MPTIEERMLRNSTEDKIELGNIVERATSGDFGKVLKYIINGIHDQELSDSKRITSINADRVLGRLESLNQLKEDLDTIIETKNSLLEDIKKEQEIKGSGSGEPATI